MTIAIPYINKANHFRVMMALYDAMAEQYNTEVQQERDRGDFNRNPLRSSHREIYIQLINIAASQMEENRIRFSDSKYMVLQRDSRTSYVIHTNRKSLSLRTKKSEATIYRQIMRLWDANIILGKKTHGPVRDFDIVMNPDLLLISDDMTVDFDPIRDILTHSENQLVTNYLRSFCTPIDNTLNDIKNRIIPEQKKVSAIRPTISMNKPEQIDRNTGGSDRVEAEWKELCALNPKINEFSKEIKRNLSRKYAAGTPNAFGVVISPVPGRGGTEEKRPVPDSKINEFKESNSEYAKRMQDCRDAIKRRTMRYAIRLVEFMISILFKDKVIYQGEREKAYKVAEWYFEKWSPLGNRACDTAELQYRERIRMVRNFLDRKAGRYNWDYIFPAAYLNPENYASGFIMTEKWVKASEKYKKLKAYNRIRNDEEAIYTNAVDRFLKYKNTWTYRSSYSYLQRYAPRKLSDFDAMARAVLNTGPAKQRGVV